MTTCSKAKTCVLSTSAKAKGKVPKLIFHVSPTSPTRDDAMFAYDSYFFTKDMCELFYQFEEKSCWLNG